MPESLTLLAPTTTHHPSPITLPPNITLRPPTPADTPALAALYFAAYPPGAACATLAEATEDIRATFAGAYGNLWPAASALIEHHDQESPNPTLVAAILTVHRAPWEGTPACPFIVELFTAPTHRRRGLARLALTHALTTTHAANAPALALRVATDNTPARTLYASLGFTPWPPLASSAHSENQQLRPGI